MEKCPVCMAVYGGKKRCHRCKSDLTNFAAIEEGAKVQLTMALAAFKRGDYSKAAEHAGRSCWLKHSKQAQRIWTHALNLGQ